LSLVANQKRHSIYAYSISARNFSGCSKKGNLTRTIGEREYSPCCCCPRSGPVGALFSVCDGGGDETSVEKRSRALGDNQIEAHKK